MFLCRWIRTQTPADDTRVPRLTNFSFQSSSCCCPARDKLPFTSIKFRATRTVTVRKTVTASARSVARRDGVDALVEAETLAVDYDRDHQLFARHVCPRCPSGAVIGSNGAQACCTRKTVTKSNSKTLIKTRTVTVTGKAVSFFRQGFLPTMSLTLVDYRKSLLPVASGG